MHDLMTINAKVISKHVNQHSGVPLQTYLNFQTKLFGTFQEQPIGVRRGKEFRDDKDAFGRRQANILGFEPTPGEIQISPAF